MLKQNAKILLKNLF